MVLSATSVHSPGSQTTQTSHICETTQSRRISMKRKASLLACLRNGSRLLTAPVKKRVMDSAWFCNSTSDQRLVRAFLPRRFGLKSFSGQLGRLRACVCFPDPSFISSLHLRILSESLLAARSHGAYVLYVSMYVCGVG